MIRVTDTRREWVNKEADVRRPARIPGRFCVSVCFVTVCVVVVNDGVFCSLGSVACHQQHRPPSTIANTLKWSAVQTSAQAKVNRVSPEHVCNVRKSLLRTCCLHPPKTKTLGTQSKN